ncbi:MAG TPA: hypothetical protein QGF58_22990 [Myxococcota bacterium]|nr:hypothetical protein [Myxococcota bacterium]
MMWLVATALAAEQGPVIRGDRESFDAHSEGRELTPGEFAGLVGDVPVAEAYTLAAQENRRARGLGWAVGMPIMAAGAGGLFVGINQADPMTMMGGSLVMLAGGMTLATFLTVYSARKHELDRLERWYRFDHAVALAGGAELPGTAPIELLQSAGGVEAYLADDELTAGQFARAVGDVGTYRRIRALEVMNTTAGVALCVVGYNGMMVGAEGLENGTMSETEVALGTAGILSAATGVALLALGRRVYTDMDTWYTYPEAAGRLGSAP